MNFILKKENLISLLLLAGAIFVALFLIFGAKEINAKNNGVSYLESVGEGIMAPACGSSNSGVTCVGSAPSVNFSWSADPDMVCLPNGSRIIINPGPLTRFVIARNLPCAGTYTWDSSSLTPPQLNTEYRYAIVDYTWHAISTGSFSTPPNCSVPLYTLSVSSSGASNVAITSTTGHGSPPNTPYQKTGLAAGINVNLTAPATSGSNNFTGWNGCNSVSGAGGVTCAVTMSSDKTVTANYAPASGKAVTLTASPPSLVQNSGNFTVDWITSGYNFFELSGDWIGMYLVGAVDTDFVTFQYLLGFSSGTKSFSSNFAPGTYEFRYFDTSTGYEGNSLATSNTVTITVPAAPTLVITPATNIISVGEITQLTAIYDPDGAGPLPGENVTSKYVGVADRTDWTSDNPSIADVDPNGIIRNMGSIRGNAVGNTTIRAVYKGVSGSASVIVEPAPSSDLSVVLTPTPTSGAAPLSVSFRADVSGSVVPSTLGSLRYSFYWDCPNPGFVGCGVLPSASPGSCVSNAVGAICYYAPPDASRLSATVNHTYTAGGMFSPKVWVQYVYNTTVNAQDIKTITVTAPPPPAFSYTLSNSGTSNVTKTSGNAFTQNTITKTLTSGTTEPVTLSLSGVPGGTSYSISNSACSPTCSSVITFTVTPSTPAGTYRITVTGSPLNKQTTFNLVISGSPMSVTCSASPGTALLGETVKWTANVSGGTPPFTYSWNGTGMPTSPPPSTNPFSISYSTIGQKTATVTVTDTDSVVATCQAGVVQIKFNPDLEEF